MSQAFSMRLGHIAVAQVCEAVGFTSAENVACVQLSNLASEYAQLLGRNARDYAELAGRHDVSLDDLGLALADANCTPTSLEHFLAKANVPFARVNPGQFPVPAAPLRSGPATTSADAETAAGATAPRQRRPAYVYDFMPPLPEMVSALAADPAPAVAAPSAAAVAAAAESEVAVKRPREDPGAPSAPEQPGPAVSTANPDPAAAMVVDEDGPAPTTTGAASASAAAENGTSLIRVPLAPLPKGLTPPSRPAIKAADLAGDVGAGGLLGSDTSSSGAAPAIPPMVEPVRAMRPRATRHRPKPVVSAPTATPAAQSPHPSVGLKLKIKAPECAAPKPAPKPAPTFTPAPAPAKPVPVAPQRPAAVKSTAVLSVAPAAAPAQPPSKPAPSKPAAVVAKVPKPTAVAAAALSVPTPAPVVAEARKRQRSPETATGFNGGTKRRREDSPVHHRPKAPRPAPAPAPAAGAGDSRDSDDDAPLVIVPSPHKRPKVARSKSPKGKAAGAPRAKHKKPTTGKASDPSLTVMSGSGGLKIRMKLSAPPPKPKPDPKPSAPPPAAPVAAAPPAAGSETWCKCRSSDPNGAYAECDVCQKWYHPMCVGYPSNTLTTAAFLCDVCERSMGKYEQTVASNLVQQLMAKDTWKLFHHAVPKSTPGYYALITRPMDLTTVQSRLDKGRYKKLGEFCNDILQIFENCNKFNHHTPNILEYSRPLEEKLRKQLERKFKGKQKR